MRRLAVAAVVVGVVASVLGPAYAASAGAVLSGGVPGSAHSRYLADGVPGLSVYGDSLPGSVYGDSLPSSVYGDSLPGSVYGDLHAARRAGQADRSDCQASLTHARYRGWLGDGARLSAADRRRSALAAERP
jgi:hypothetical protein